jgi:hypothetical protein
VRNFSENPEKHSDFPVKNPEKQGTTNPLLHFIGTYAIHKQPQELEFWL